MSIPFNLEKATQAKKEGKINFRLRNFLDANIIDWHYFEGADSYPMKIIFDDGHVNGFNDDLLEMLPETRTVYEVVATRTFVDKDSYEYFVQDRNSDWVYKITEKQIEI